MIKMICDVCKKEIKRNTRTDLFMPRANGFKVECEVLSIDSVGYIEDRKGELCIDCLKEIINNGQERRY